MAYQVELATRALRDLDLLYVEKHVEDSSSAARWFNRLEKAVLTLSEHPKRCPITKDAGKNKREIRHLLYGKKPHIYRILFEIDESSRTVQVLTIRHGAQDSFNNQASRDH